MSADARREKVYALIRSVGAKPEHATPQWLEEMSALLREHGDDQAAAREAWLALPRRPFPSDALVDELTAERDALAVEVEQLRQRNRQLERAMEQMLGDDWPEWNEEALAALAAPGAAE